MKLYSEKIKRDLKRLGWTQGYLAEQIGMTRQGLSVALKRKTAPLRTIGIIADILGVDPRDLLLTGNSIKNPGLVGCKTQADKELYPAEVE